MVSEVEQLIGFVYRAVFHFSFTLNFKYISLFLMFIWAFDSISRNSILHFGVGGIVESLKDII